MAAWRTLRRERCIKVLPDREASREGYIRVIDESGVANARDNASLERSPGLVPHLKVQRSFV